MKHSRYSDSQIMAILNQAEAGVPVSLIPVTYYIIAHRLYFHSSTIA